jgi:photosystem II stability/assembly factor-like uncharacterized protein
MRVSTLLRSVVGAGLTTLFLGGCDKDPTALEPVTLAPRLAIAADTVIARQGSIRVLFPGTAINQATALDPANFVVTNTCTGLPVPGSLRFSGDTLVFTPSQALPFLTGLSVRIQGVLDENNNAMKQPVIFRLRTENPPVSDVSWEQLSSPTNDFIDGVSFLDRDYGFITTNTGGVYRTENSGLSFRALFKDPDVTGTADIRVVSKDSVYVVGSPSFGGTSFSATALSRSVDAGNTFPIVFSDDPANMNSLSLRKRTGVAPEMVMGGSIPGRLAAWRYDQEKDSIARFVSPDANTFGAMADLSPDGANAVVVGGLQTSQSPPAAIGVAYRSTDGGRSYTRITAATGLPTTPRFFGAGFINNTDAFLLGDTSTVLRVNTTTGQVTVLGDANGIPQSSFDQATGTRLVYVYRRARFAPDDPNVGWIIGFVVRRVPGQADVRRGVLLITRDGGQHFTRQAVSNAPENGLGFPELFDIFVLNKNFAVVVGDAGFIAARKSDTQNFAGLCSFRTTE